MDDVMRAVARMMCVGFDGPAMTSSLRELINRGVSSVILFTRNYESPQQLCELCHAIKSSAPRPIMICVDQEGGRVQRFGKPFTIIPSMREIGRGGEESLAREVGTVLARELRAVNIDMNLAPVLDVDSNPRNPVIGARSFSADADVVARMGCAMIEAMHNQGVAACGKHFPGHGDTGVDSHVELPRLSHDLDRLQRVELRPFAAAVKADVAAIMTSHIIFEALDPSRPATMCQAVLDGLLRRQLGFRGVVVSDDLEMKAIDDHFGVERAVLEGAVAGVDLFMVCRHIDLQHRAIDALSAAVQRGEVPTERVAHANERLDSLFQRFVRPPEHWDSRSSAIIGCAEHQTTVRGAKS
jgi:beta-N-acetylhexosaminidase